MDGVIGVIGEEGAVAFLLDKGQELVGEPVGEIVPGIVVIGVLREAEILRKDDRLKSLPAGGRRPPPTAAEIPHPEESGRIPDRPEGLGDRHHLRRQVAVALRRQQLVPRGSGGLPGVDDRVDPVARRHLPRHQTGPGRRAVRGAGVRLREHEPAAGEGVERRGLDEAVPHEADVAPPHVVDQNQDHVRLAALGAEGGVPADDRNRPGEDQRRPRSTPLPRGAHSSLSRS